METFEKIDRSGDYSSTQMQDESRRALNKDLGYEFFRNRNREMLEQKITWRIRKKEVDKDRGAYARRKNRVYLSQMKTKDGDTWKVSVYRREKGSCGDVTGEAESNRSKIRTSQTREW